VVIECPAEDADARSAELRAMMEDTPKRILKPKVEFPVDIHVGVGWGTLKSKEMTTAKPAGAEHKTDTFGKAGVASGKL
jgi:hypothetical protein